MPHIFQWTVWYHVWWTDGEHQEADQSNIKGDRQVEADVEQAEHIGTAYSQKPKLVEALHVPLCDCVRGYQTDLLLVCCFSEYFQQFIRYAARYSDLSMLMLKSISFPAMCWGATPCDRDGALNWNITHDVAVAVETLVCFWRAPVFFVSKYLAGRIFLSSRPYVDRS